MTQFCPDVCPVCGADLKFEGHPIAHQHAETGDQCEFEWDTAGHLEAEVAQESAEAMAGWEESR